MPNINAFKFDLTNCELVDSAPDKKAWMNRQDGVAHLLRFKKEPVSWSFDLTDLAAARNFYGAQCADARGAMLSMDVLKRDEIEILRGIFKYRAPAPNELAMLTVGILWIPFKDFDYQLNVESMERGTTGMREAAVYSMDPEDYPDPSVLQRCPWPEEEADAEPIVVTSAEEMFEHMKKSRVKELPSDDAQFDDMFPHHPLSLVRKRLDAIVNSLKIDKGLFGSLKPFRIRSH